MWNKQSGITRVLCYYHRIQGENWRAHLWSTRALYHSLSLDVIATFYKYIHKAVVLGRSEPSVQIVSFSLLGLSEGRLCEQPSCAQRFNEYRVCCGELGVDLGAAARQTGIQCGAGLFLALWQHGYNWRNGAKSFNPLETFQKVT